MTRESARIELCTLKDEMRNFLAPQLIVSDMSLDTTAARLLDPSVASLFSRTGGTPLTPVLMFSGGRDSSVAALRMYEKGTMPILVTISSWHLTGIDRVRERVNEIKRRMPADIPWLIIRQP